MPTIELACLDMAGTTVSDTLLASYLMFLLAALLGVGGLITARRLTRTT